MSCYHLYSIFHVYVFLPGSGGCHSNFTHGFYSPLSPAPLAGPLATGGGFTGTLWQIVGDMGQFPGYNGITRLLFGRNQNCQTYCASTKVDEAWGKIMLPLLSCYLFWAGMKNQVGVLWKKLGIRLATHETTFMMLTNHLLQVLLTLGHSPLNWLLYQEDGAGDHCMGLQLSSTTPLSILIGKQMPQNREADSFFAQQPKVSKSITTE